LKSAIKEDVCHFGGIDRHARTKRSVAVTEKDGSSADKVGFAVMIQVGDSGDRRAGADGDGRLEGAIAISKERSRLETSRRYPRGHHR
jgi:hypothetical protein